MPVCAVVVIVVAGVLAYIVVGGIWAGIAKGRGVDWQDPSLVLGAIFWPIGLLVLVGYYIAKCIAASEKKKSLEDRVVNLERTRREHMEDIQGNTDGIHMHSSNSYRHVGEEDHLFAEALQARIAALEDMHKPAAKKPKKKRKK
jgi:hypothetical protein